MKRNLKPTLAIGVIQAPALSVQGKLQVPILAHNAYIKQHIQEIQNKFKS